MQLAQAFIAQSLDRALRLAPGVISIERARSERRSRKLAERVARLAGAWRAYVHVARARAVK